jgi:multidrug resistance efflux pump
MNADLQAELEAAEATLLQMAIATKDAYRRYRDLDTAQTAKAEEIKDLRRRMAAQGQEG